MGTMGGKSKEKQRQRQTSPNTCAKHRPTRMIRACFARRGGGRRHARKSKKETTPKPTKNETNEKEDARLEKVPIFQYDLRFARRVCYIGRFLSLNKEFPHILYLGKFRDSPPFKKKLKICSWLAPFLRAFARYAPPHTPRAGFRLRWLALARVCSRWLALLRVFSRCLALTRACSLALSRAKSPWLALARSDPQSLVPPLGRVLACSPVPRPCPLRLRALAGRESRPLARSNSHEEVANS